MTIGISVVACLAAVTAGVCEATMIVDLEPDEFIGQPA
jgi:ribonuclease PH